LFNKPQRKEEHKEKTMPLKNYGVLMGFPIERKLGLGGESPHYQIHMVDNEFDYRIAVNVKSKAHPSEVKFLLIDDFRHPITDELRNLEPGFTGIESKPGGIALDYVRGNLFNPDQMEVLPHNVPGPENDLNEKIDKYVKPAIEEPNAEIYAFGEPWGPENIKDRYFGFRPGEFYRVQLSGGKAQLSNKGGIITLLDKKGVKVHGVSYTRTRAREEGWTILF
jgi:uncharacterized protein YukJ